MGLLDSFHPGLLPTASAATTGVNQPPSPFAKPSAQGTPILSAPFLGSRPQSLTPTPPILAPSHVTQQEIHQTMPPQHGPYFEQKQKQHQEFEKEQSGQNIRISDGSGNVWLANPAQAEAALKEGFSRVVIMYDGTGQAYSVPFDKVSAAKEEGFTASKPTPEWDKEHPPAPTMGSTYFGGLGNTLAGFAKFPVEVGKAVSDPTYAGQQVAELVRQVEKSGERGHGLPYKTISIIGGLIPGLNVGEMETHAEQGHPGAVFESALVPLTLTGAAEFSKSKTAGKLYEKGSKSLSEAGARSMSRATGSGVEAGREVHKIAPITGTERSMVPTLRSRANEARSVGNVDVADKLSHAADTLEHRVKLQDTQKVGQSLWHLLRPKAPQSLTEGVTLGSLTAINAAINHGADFNSVPGATRLVFGEGAIAAFQALAKTMPGRLMVNAFRRAVADGLMNLSDTIKRPPSGGGSGSGGPTSGLPRSGPTPRSGGEVPVIDVIQKAAERTMRARDPQTGRFSKSAGPNIAIEARTGEHIPIGGKVSTKPKAPPPTPTEIKDAAKIMSPEERAALGKAYEQGGQTSEGGTPKAPPKLGSEVEKSEAAKLTSQEERAELERLYKEQTGPKVPPIPKVPDPFAPKPQLPPTKKPPGSVRPPATGHQGLTARFLVDNLDRALPKKEMLTKWTQEFINQFKRKPTTEESVHFVKELNKRQNQPNVGKISELDKLKAKGWKLNDDGTLSHPTGHSGRFSPEQALKWQKHLDERPNFGPGAARGDDPSFNKSPTEGINYKSKSKEVVALEEKWRKDQQTMWKKTFGEDVSPTDEELHIFAERFKKVRDDMIKKGTYTGAKDAMHQISSAVIAAKALGIEKPFEVLRMTPEEYMKAITEAARKTFGPGAANVNDPAFGKRTAKVKTKWPEGTTLMSLIHKWIEQVRVGQITEDQYHEMLHAAQSDKDLPRGPAPEPLTNDELNNLFRKE